MGRAPCCDKAKVKRGPWSPEEDAKLKDYIHNYGTGNNWIALPHKAGLKRCGKSCRLRWLNYLRPNIKHGDFSDEEDTIICTLFAAIGSRWSIIAAQLPGRTDNDIKNYWNTKLKKKLMMGMSNTVINNPQLPSVLHNSPSPDSNSLLLSSSPPFHYYNAPPSASLSPTGFDQASGGLLVNSPNGLTTTSASTAGGYSNYLVCGGAQQPSYSYTSSDGSYSNINQYDHHGMGFQNNTTSFSLGETPALLGYGLEEIKQLVSATTNNTATSTISSSSQNGDGSNSNSFYFDENSTMHYYY